MKKLLILTVAVLFISSVCFAQVPHLLNVFAVDSEGWNRNFGAEIGSIAQRWPLQTREQPSPW